MGAPLARAAFTAPSVSAVSPDWDKGHDERPGPDGRIPVAELRAEIHLGGDAGQPLDHEASHDGRVVRRAARDQDDALDGLRHLPVEPDVGEDDGAALGLDAPAHRVGGGARLLVDLLQHEVAIAALLGEDRVPLDAHGARSTGAPSRWRDLHAVARHHRDVLVLQDHDVARVRQDGRDVGGEERLVLAQAHHHAARPVLGRHEAVGRILRQHHDGVGAAQLAERPAHRLVEARRVRQVPLDQVGDHLGVGLGGEAMPLGLQPLLDGEVVLDDPVVHDDEAARAVGMGMRVLVGRAAVGRPPRVADADGPRGAAARAGAPPAP